MMFALREIVISLTFFVLFYCCFSMTVLVGWRALKRLRISDKSLANLLFLARVLPMLASLAITCVFVVPSFQLLEPRGTEEGTGILPVALGVAALFLIAFGCYRVFKAQTGTTRIVAEWLAKGQSRVAGAYTVCTRRDVPPLTLVGLLNPRVLVSDLTLRLLTENEMRIALRHESAHMCFRDNFKKLILRFCPFPGMTPLETAWAETAELAADHAAVSTVDDAVELASALVKLSRLLPIQSAPLCTVGFIIGSVGTRVARLLEWNEAKEYGSPLPRWASISVLIALALALVPTYGPALVIAHNVTEWLVR